MTRSRKSRVDVSEHARLLAWLGLVRTLLAAGVGGWLLHRAGRIIPEFRGQYAVETLLGDQLRFRVVAGVLFALAALWLAQALGMLLRAAWSRPFGLVVAVLDLLNVPLFPLSTAWGLYGIVVHAHPAAPPAEPPASPVEVSQRDRGEGRRALRRGG